VFDSYQAASWNKNAQWREEYQELRELLDDKDYEAARATTKNAHYTSPTVVKGMWQALDRMGYRGGRVLEPSAGIGHFVGLMPDHIHTESETVAVEIDALTGRILGQLYQDADTRITGYEEANLPNNFFDVAVGNVPFGDYGVYDPSYTRDRKRLTKRIHNYFFAKALDQVKAGGVVAFVTSRYTMDSTKHRYVREYLASQADLVGAIRLPNTAFKKNANTEVTTDIIFLRKREDGEEPNDVSWVDTAPMTVPNSRGGETDIEVNQYFHDNPDMMMGRMEATGSMYSDAQPQLVEDDRDLDKALAEAIQGLPADIAPKRELERCPACQAFLPATGACANPKCPTKRDVYKPAPVDLTAQEDAYVIDDEDGMVYQRKGSRLVRVETTQEEADAAEVSRDAAFDTLPDGAIAVKGQKKLQKGFTNLKNSDEYQAYLQAQDNLRDIRGRFNDMERVKAMIPVRDAADEVLQLNLANASNTELEAARARLNQVYDAFVEKHGYLNDYNNFKAMRDDPGLDRLMSLEHNIQTEGRKVVSADKMAIFDRRTIRLTERPESADTALDALMISLNEYGEPNLGRMSELTGRSREDVANELLEQGHIYFSPDGNWVTRDEYLSGSVREKLRQAQAAAALDPQYQRNVEALRQVQPEAIPPEDIYVGFGAGWIPPSDMKSFLQEEIFNRWDDVDVRYMPETGTWFMAADVNSWSTNNTREWGIPEAPATRLIDDGLNNRQTTVYKVVGKDENGRNIRVVDEEKTYEAREKQKKIIQRFQKWIWEDETRAARLAQIYNEKFNAYVPRQYDGSHLTFPGLADGVFGYDANGRPHELRPHQKNAAWRMIQNDSSLLAHIVGSGKTATMIAGAMEMRRMGIAKKPMITVPNHMPEQFAEDWRRMYPAANILVIDSDRLKPSEKAKTMNQIATGDWDGIVITHSAFTRIPVSAEARASFIREEISKLRLFLEEVEGEESNYGYGRSKKQHKKTVKQIEKAISRLETQLKKNLNSPKEEGVLEWEELGVDALMVDEAHMFKNLFTATKMTRVAGVKANVGSKRAMDMFIKTQYLQRRCQCGRFVSPSGICQNCGNKAEIVKGKVIFATGTPVTNSMGEVYTMQRYLQRDTLETAGLGHFDAWANQFGEMVTSIEMKPSGKGFRQKTRFARFHNVPELMRMWAEVADIQQDPEKMGLPRPLLRGGDPTAYEVARRRFVEFAGGSEALNRFDKLADDYQHLKDTSQYQEFLAARLEYRKAMTVSVPMNKYQEAIIDKCDERAENLPPDPSVDNMLKIVNDARLASLDVRLINPNLPDDPNSKVNVCVRRMVDIYHETTGVEVPGVEGKHNMAQMLFLDTGTPGGANLNLYKDIKQKLIAEGVPEDEIAFIHDAGDDKAKKLELFQKINRGELRFLLGSTEKMGTGTNAQRLLAALHHLDVPWRPDQVEQREGRIIRQGNLNSEVEVFRYGTEKSFDVYMWQTNETKAGFIFQVMNGDPTIRSMEDIDEAQIGYAQAKAIFSGNPEAMEIVKVEADLRKLEALVRAHRNTRRDLRWELDNIPKQRQYTRMMADRYREAAAAVQWPKQKDAFAMTVNGRTYDKRLEAGESLVDIITKNKNERGRVMFTGEIGNLYGARITLESNETELKKSGRDYGRAVIEIGRVREKIDLGTSAEGNVTRMVNVLKRLEEKQREHEQTLADLDEREPKIRALLEQPFEKAEALERTRQRYEELREVVSKLEAEGERKQSIDESFGGQDKDDDDDDNAETTEYTTDMDVSDLLEMAQA
jgi:N12 class adenine-specific DNA methylase